MQSLETEQSQTSSCDSSGIAIKRCGQASMWGTISTREEVLITMVPLRFCFLQFQFTTQLTWIQMQMILFLTCGQRISSSLSYVTLLKSFTSLHLQCRHFIISHHHKKKKSRYTTMRFIEREREHFYIVLLWHIIIILFIIIFVNLLLYLIYELNFIIDLNVCIRIVCIVYIGFETICDFRGFWRISP